MERGTLKRTLYQVSVIRAIGPEILCPILTDRCKAVSFASLTGMVVEAEWDWDFVSSVFAIIPVALPDLGALCIQAIVYSSIEHLWTPKEHLISFVCAN